MLVLAKGCRQVVSTTELRFLAVVDVGNLRPRWIWLLSLSYCYIAPGVLGLEQYYSSLGLHLHIASPHAFCLLGSASF